MRIEALRLVAVGLLFGACALHESQGTKDAGPPPLLALDPCAARNPVRVLDVVHVRHAGHVRGEAFSFQLPVDAPVCVRLLNPASPGSCSRDAGNGSHDDQAEDDDDDGDDDDDDDDDDDGGDDDDDGDHDGDGHGNGAGGGTGGGLGAPCRGGRQTWADVVLDTTVLAAHSGLQPGGALSRALQLGAGTHIVRVRVDGASGSQLAVRVDVPGPVVDDLAPVAGLPGTELTMRGEGFFAPITVQSGATSLASPSVLSQAEVTVSTVEGITPRPLVVTTPFASTTTSQAFTPLQPAPLPADPWLDAHQNGLLATLESRSAVPLYVQSWARAGVVSRLDLKVPSGAFPGSTLESDPSATPG